MTDAAHSNRPPPAWLIIAIMLGAAGLGIYWDQTYSGPYRWVAELQLKWIGQYEKTITFLLALGIVLAPFMLIAGVYRLAVRGRKRAAEATTASAIETSQASPTEAAPKPAAAASTSSQMAAFNRYFAPITIGIAAVVLMFLGVQKWRLSRNAGEMISAEARDFETGKHPGPWVKVTGNPLVEQALSTDSSRSSRKHYLPLVSASWEPGSPVAVFVEVDERDDANALRKAAEQGYHGMVQRNGLPGMVRVAFERAGLPPAATYDVIDFDRSPSDEARIARDCLLFGGGGLIAAVAWMLFDRRRARRAAAPAGVQAALAGARPQHQIKAIVTVDPPSDASKPS